MRAFSYGLILAGTLLTQGSFAAEQVSPTSPELAEFFVEANGARNPDAAAALLERKDAGLRDKLCAEIVETDFLQKAKNASLSNLKAMRISSFCQEKKSEFTKQQREVGTLEEERKKVTVKKFSKTQADVGQLGEKASQFEEQALRKAAETAAAAEREAAAKIRAAEIESAREKAAEAEAAAKIKAEEEEAKKQKTLEEAAAAERKAAMKEEARMKATQELEKQKTAAAEVEKQKVLEEEAAEEEARVKAAQAAAVKPKTTLVERAAPAVGPMSAVAQAAEASFEEREKKLQAFEQDIRSEIRALTDKSKVEEIETKLITSEDLRKRAHEMYEILSMELVVPEGQIIHQMGNISDASHAERARSLFYPPMRGHQYTYEERIRNIERVITHKDINEIMQVRREKTYKGPKKELVELKKILTEAKALLAQAEAQDKEAKEILNKATK